MKKLIAVLVGVMLLGSFGVASAQELTDSQLAGIYAGQFEVSVDDTIVANNSAVAHQRNAAAIGSFDGGVGGSLVMNDNAADVLNAGDSAVALQTNIAAIAGLGVNPSDENLILNSNTALVDNLFLSDGSVEGTLNGTAVSGDVLEFADVVALQSAVAHQDNISAVMGNGSASFNEITSLNLATVLNMGDSAVAVQNNVAAIAGFGTDPSSGNLIVNSNEATVDNIIASSGGGVDAASDDEIVSTEDFLFNSVSAVQSAVASQTNIAAVIGGGDVIGTAILNTNSATVTNGP